MSSARSTPQNTASPHFFEDNPRASSSFLIGPGQKEPARKYTQESRHVWVVDLHSHANISRPGYVDTAPVVISTALVRGEALDHHLTWIPGWDAMEVSLLKDPSWKQIGYWGRHAKRKPLCSII